MTLDTRVLTGLSTTAAGPLAARALVTSGATAARPCLDATEAASIYTINRTPVARARAVLSAAASESFLAEVVRRERRVSLVEAALSNPLCPLEAVVDAISGRVRTGGHLTWHFLTRSVHSALGNYCRRHGLAAAAKMVVSAQGQARDMCEDALGAQPGLLDDPEVVDCLMVADAERALTGAIERGDVPHGVAWRMVEERNWSLMRALATKPRLMADVPALAEAIVAACEEGSGASDRFEIGFPVSALAEAPLGADLLGRLVAVAPSDTLRMLAQNPHTPVAALAACQVGGSAFDRGAVLGRILAERVGDDERAYLLAAHLAMGATGTYGELVDAVAASMA